MTLTSPEEELNITPLNLETKEAVPVIDSTPDSISGFIKPLSQSQELEISKQAKAYISDVVKINPNAPEFAAKVSAIQNLANREIAASGQGASRLLERKSSSLNAAKKDGGDATVKVAKTLNELRSTVEDLTPNANELNKGVKKFLGFLPGGKKINQYFHKYESAQEQLDNITKSLLSGKDDLLKDNASIHQEKQSLWKAMGELNEYAFFASQLDEEISQEIATLRSNGDVETANKFESDFLFPVRQRRQDLMTQLAVSIQGYMAMELIRQNNVELIKGVERARTTTITALRTAVAVAQALDTQKLTLDKIDAINAATNNTIEQTSIMLRQQTSRVHQQAVSSGVTVATLEKAFDNIFATMDEIENFKSTANANMKTTIDGLATQLERAKPQIDRARALEERENASNSGASAYRSLENK